MVKNLLLYLKANYGKPCSFSPLLSSLTAKNMGAESRSCEVTPDLSLCASTCVCVCGCVSMWVSLSFSHLTRSAPETPTFTFELKSKQSLLLELGKRNRIFFLADLCIGRKTPCAPVQIDFGWFWVSQLLADIRSVLWFFIYFTIQWIPN